MTPVARLWTRRAVIDPTRLGAASRMASNAFGGPPAPHPVVPPKSRNRRVAGRFRVLAVLAVGRDPALNFSCRWRVAASRPRMCSIHVIEGPAKIPPASVCIVAAAQRGGQNPIDLTGFDVNLPLQIATLDASIGRKVRLQASPRKGRSPRHNRPRAVDRAKAASTKPSASLGQILPRPLSTVALGSPCGLPLLKLNVVGKTGNC